MGVDHPGRAFAVAGPHRLAVKALRTEASCTVAPGAVERKRQKAAVCSDVLGVAGPERRNRARHVVGRQWADDQNVFLNSSRLGVPAWLFLITPLVALLVIQLLTVDEAASPFAPL